MLPPLSKCEIEPWCFSPEPQTDRFNSYSNSYSLFSHCKFKPCCTILPLTSTQHCCLRFDLSYRLVNQHSLTSNVSYRMNRFSVASDWNENHLSHFPLCALLGPFFVKVWENCPNIPHNLITMSSHSQLADRGLCDCDCFSIGEDYLRVYTLHRHGPVEKSVSGFESKWTGC